MSFWNHEQVVETTASGIKIKNLPDDRPKFKRRYTVTISPQVSMKVEIYDSNGYIFDLSELDQSNGRWVLFDLNAPADKILDRDILPTIQKFCKEISDLDCAYRRSDPAEFIDDRGVKWRRVE